MKRHFAMVKPYLDDVELMVIASSLNGQPWCTTVYFAYDEDLNIYFMSRMARRHSMELAENAKASVALASQKYHWGDSSKGLQAEGRCEALADAKIAHALDVYVRRFPRVASVFDLEEIKRGHASETVWQFTPQMIKVYDVNKYVHEGTELRD
ncbi:MAG: pyridoxamine 5'-phosphate oxidase family protein [Bradyrhizobium sp.]